MSKDESANAALIVPLSSFKMTSSGPVAFIVGSDNKLVSQKVVLGDITGDSVVVVEGLTPDTRIVVDARGLKEGQEVEVAQ